MTVTSFTRAFVASLTLLFGANAVYGAVNITASYSITTGANAPVTVLQPSPSNPGTITNSTQNGGRFNWTVASGGNPSGVALRASDGSFSTTNFMSFCIELSDTVGGGNNTYELVALNSAPRPADSSSPMGAISEMRMEKLWKAYMPTILATASPTTTQVAAFQMAVWELVYDNGTAKPVVWAGGTNNVPADVAARGNFYNTSASFPNGSVQAVAQAMLDTVWADDPYNPGRTTNDILPRANLMALSSYTGGAQPMGVQDQVVEVVPEPASLAIWSVLAGGAAGLSVAKRRRRGNGRWDHKTRNAIFAVVENTKGQD